MNIVAKTTGPAGTPVVWYATPRSARGVSLIDTPADIDEPYRVSVDVPGDVTEVYCYYDLADALRYHIEHPGSWLWMRGENGRENLTYQYVSKARRTAIVRKEIGGAVVAEIPLAGR